MQKQTLSFPKTDSRAGLESFAEIARDIRRILKESNAALRGNSAKLDALMQHLGVPYEKGPRKSAKA